LPTYEDLSKEQDAILNLPLKGNYLIAGPPGSGKTVMAVYRAMTYTRAKKDTQLVVYNNTLDQYLDQTKNQTKLDSRTSTFHKWFWSWHYINFGRKPPQIERYVFDWHQILENMLRKKKFNQIDCLIIDEGQDFPPIFYVVATTMARNVTVFADENQRIIEDQNSTLQEIRNNLNVDKIYKLTRNYRNTGQIAKLCNQFFSDLTTGIPKLPNRKGTKPKVYLNCDLQCQAKRIATYANNNRHHSIGVFLKHTKQQFAFMHRIKELTDVPINMYLSTGKNYKDLDFGLRGIKILNYQSTKGLEFNAVFLPELQSLRSDANKDFQKMVFFVLTSRARDQLWMLSRDQRVPDCLSHVSDDLYELYG